jgi:hypothetical protein
MRTRSNRSLLAPAALVAALTIASLAGCSSGTSGSSSTPSASSSSAASETLPSDFPKKDVPLIDGAILVARGDAANGWSVTVQPKNKTGFADAGALLTKAGYTPQGAATDTKAVFTNDKYTVAVGTPGVSVTYLVTAN